MKKIFLAVLLVVFSFSAANAQPFRNNHHNGGHNNYVQLPRQQVVIKNKTSKTEKVAVGLLAGITGIVVLDKVINGSVGYTQPATTNNYYYTPAPQQAQHCVTTVSRYSGTTTTTCSSQPQTHEVIYIN